MSLKEEWFSFGDNLVVFYYFCVFKIWTDKRTSLWWEGPYKGETTVVRTSLWWEWPYKGGPTVVRTSYLFNNFAEI